MHPTVTPSTPHPAGVNNHDMTPPPPPPVGDALAGGTTTRLRGRGGDRDVDDGDQS
jgi:hypothetical protein